MSIPPSRALEHAEAEVRRIGIVELEHADSFDPSLLMRGLGDVDWRVRKEAVGVAERVALRVGLLPALLRAVEQGENVGLRNAALDVLRHLGDAAMHAVLDALANGPSGARTFYVDVLGDLGGPGAIAALVRASDLDDANVSAAALDALARLGGPEAAAALRNKLHARTGYARLVALDGLARMRASVPVSEVAPQLVDDPITRRHALMVLGASRDAAAVPSLVAALRSPPPSFPDVVVLGLRRLFERGSETEAAVRRAALALSPEDLQTILELVDDPSADVCHAALLLLLLARAPAAFGPLVTHGHDGLLPPPVVDVLGAYGGDAIPALLAVADERAGIERAFALELASEVATRAAGDAGATARVRVALREALEDPDNVVVVAAVGAIAAHAGPEDVPTLVRLASEGFDPIVRACAEALRRLSVDHKDAVEAALDANRMDGTAAAPLLVVYGRIGGERAFERLRAALSADEYEVRSAAVEGLAFLDDPRAVELVGLAVADEHRDVQLAAVHALGRLRDGAGRARGIDRLLLCLASDDHPLQIAAARALGATYDARAEVALAELVGSPAPGVAFAAMDALGAMAAPKINEVLDVALGHFDDEVVKRALDTLADDDDALAASLPRLIRALEHDSWDVRTLAARLVARVPGSASQHALGARLAVEDDAMVRDVLETLLGALRDD